MDNITIAVTPERFKRWADMLRELRAEQARMKRDGAPLEELDEVIAFIEGRAAKAAALSMLLAERQRQMTNVYPGLKG